MFSPSLIPLAPLTPSTHALAHPTPTLPPNTHIQARVQADATYLDTTQQEVDAHKRLMLVDWLVEVVDEFQLSQETLFLAVALLDRFMSVKPVMSCQLQLLGTTCLWVTSKYEEVMPPSLQVRAALRCVCCACLSCGTPS
jgi:hypothetical protein